MLATDGGSTELFSNIKLTHTYICIYRSIYDRQNQPLLTIHPNTTSHVFSILDAVYIVSILN